MQRHPPMTSIPAAADDIPADAVNKAWLQGVRSAQTQRIHPLTPADAGYVNFTSGSDRKIVHPRVEVGDTVTFYDHRTGCHGWRKATVLHNFACRGSADCESSVCFNPLNSPELIGRVTIQGQDHVFETRFKTEKYAMKIKPIDQDAHVEFHPGREITLIGRGSHLTASTQKTVKAWSVEGSDTKFTLAIPYDVIPRPGDTMVQVGTEIGGLRLRTVPLGMMTTAKSLELAGITLLTKEPCASLSVEEFKLKFAQNKAAATSKKASTHKDDHPKAGKKTKKPISPTVDQAVTGTTAPPSS